MAFLTQFSYLGVMLWLLASGFGLPLPEDVPLLFGGYLCAAEDGPTLWIMLPLGFVSVLGADCTMYWMGRSYGHHVTELPFFRRFLTPARLASAKAAFHNHDGKTLFVSRFLPGLRTPVFFTAGTFKVPFWKMLVFDGSAAVLSVPVLVVAGWYFADHIHALLHMMKEAKLFMFVLMLLTVLGVIVWKAVRRRKLVPAE